MRNPLRLAAADWTGIWTVAAIGMAAFAFRQIAIVPRVTVGLCAAANAPMFCAPRAAVLWLQYEQLFGWAALALGAAGFFFGRRWPGVFAVAVGVAAVVNYNATTGVIGATLGLIAWASLSTGRFKPLV